MIDQKKLTPQAERINGKLIGRALDLKKNNIAWISQEEAKTFAQAKG